MQFNEGSEAPRREGRPGAREQLVAVAVEDTLFILSDLERRNAIDPGRAADIRWAAIRVTGAVSAEENSRFWSYYAELVVLSERLGQRTAPTIQPYPSQLPQAAPRRVHLGLVARYGAVAATLCALVLAFDNTGVLMTPRPDEPRLVAVAASSVAVVAAPAANRPMAAATAVETEPAYYVAYGRDHPNFPQPVPLPARFDPPQADM